MPEITTELPALLEKVRTPGDFAVAGTVALMLPSLDVEGVGRVALPMAPAQARLLIAAAEAAPYGRGEETLLDPAVRKTWQIGPENIRISGRHWAEMMATIVARAAAGLGVSGPVAAEFYKMLIYDPGSFFVSHRDTEKSPGMFATLLVALPADFSGGDLIVRHKGREHRLDMRCGDPGEAQFAAFYADCVHEVLPVTDGYRVVLVYNLVRAAGGKAPQPPDYSREETHLVALLESWRSDFQTIAEDKYVPQKIVYPLEHAYTQAELGFAALKGADAANAHVLSAAARRARFDLHLALLTVEENGSAEYNGGYDDDDYEMGEVFDRSVTLSQWRGTDGALLTLGEIPVEEDEIAPPEAFEKLDPDEQHFHEATGNAGAEIDRTYRRSALVLWPSERIFEVVTKAPLAATLPYLDSIVERWRAGGAARDALWEEAHDLARAMINGWPPHSPGVTDESGATQAARLLGCLARMGDAELIERFLGEISASGRLDPADNAAIVAALAHVDTSRRGTLVDAIFRGAGATLFAACANLLVRLAASPELIATADLTLAANLLAAALPDGTPAASHQRAVRGASIDAAFVVDVVTALSVIDPKLAMRAVEHMVASKNPFDMDAVLVPAARQLSAAGLLTGAPALEALRAGCLAHLGARIALPLAPPSDWRRPSEVGCRCAHCTELSHFLANPRARAWALKAKAGDRSHVESQIQTARCDVDTKTERRGSPHTLICTKNQASYERRARQRVDDLRHQSELAASS